MTWPLLRGCVYAATLGDYGEKYYLVVSNNARNRKLDSALAVRLTTSPKPLLPSIVELAGRGEAFEGRICCDDVETLYCEDDPRHLGAMSAPTMNAVNAGLRDALGLT